jgi:hypothetical protein
LPKANEIMSRMIGTRELELRAGARALRDRGLLFSGEGELVPLKTTMAVPAGDLAALEPFVD